MSRVALVWNFEDDNFTWMDASVIVDGALSNTTCMHYGFEPGWQARWNILESNSVTWEDLQNGADPWGDGTSTRWSDLYEAGEDQNMYWLTKEGVWKSDQLVDQSGVKKYYAERTGIDFDDIVQGWTSNNFKHVRQLFPLLQSPSGAPVMNAYDFSIGWSGNLMDDPDYDIKVRANLNQGKYAGKHKIDVRTTGRFMAMLWDFTYTYEINMTAVDIDVEESHGR